MAPARLALVTLAAFALALPAAAQRSPAQVTLVESPAGAPHDVLGEVKAEYHQKTLFAKVPPREMVDRQLREAAAKLGADAVVSIRYDSNSALTSKKGYLATGIAVKFTPPAAAPGPAVHVAAAAPPAVTTAPAARPVVAAHPAPAPSEPPAALPAAPAMIILSETELNTGRAYAVMGAVMSAGASRTAMDEDLRARARALGADAVIMIRYSADSAQGVAVKYK